MCSSDLLDHVGQAGGGAGGCRNDGVARGVEVVVIDAHDDGDGVFGHGQAFGLDFERGGHDDLFHPGQKMAAAGTPALVRVCG